MEISEEDLKKKIADAVAEAKKGLLNQEQVDKIVSERVNSLNEKHQKELEEKEKTAKMSESERLKHDFEVLTKERDDLKTSLASKEHKEKLSALMSDKKIDNEFYDMFAGIQDLDKAGEAMDSFNTKLQAKIDSAVDAKISPNVPHTTNKDTDDKALREAMGLKG